MKKHILFIMPDLPSGGAEKVLIDILRNFDYTTYDVTLLLEYRQGVYLKDIPSQVRFKTMFGASNIWLERWHRLLGIMHCGHLYHAIVHKLILLFTLRGMKFDTIVSFMEGEAVRLHSYIMKKASNHVSWVHIDLKTKHWSQVFFKNDQQEKGIYEQMDKIVFVSEEARTKFLELFNIEKDKCCVQYNLIDAKTIRELAHSKKVEKEKLTICMVGRLNPQKRYDRALRTVKRLKEDGLDFVLWILGEGGMENELKSMTRELGIESHVQFKGFVKPSYASMQAADIYWNTSEAEGYPLVVCEALCLGLPVVATRICGTNEILNDGNYGLLTQEDDESIYQGIKGMLESANMRMEYATKALQGAETFDVKKVMNDIYQILG